MSKVSAKFETVSNLGGNKPKISLSSHKKKEKAWCYLFILPQTILLLMFTIYPIVMSYVYSLFKWDGIGPFEDFVGFSNYIETVGDPYFWNALKNSFIYMFALVLIQLPLALIVAMILNAHWMKASTFYRTIYFLPVVTTTAVVGVLMRFIFGAHKGFVNEVLMRFGLLNKPVDWLGNVDTALIIVIVVGIWKGFGMKLIYWLAGLQSLPRDVYEAAKVDGANVYQSFRYITIPLLLPIGSVIVLLSAVDALHVFDLVKTMTEGGPAFSTDMVDVYIYRYAFGSQGYSRVGFASAVGVFYGLFVLIISLLLGWIVRKSGGKSGYQY